MIDWNKLTKVDASKIHEIAKRAFFELSGLSGNLLDLEMDISATHLSNPLRLDELLAAKPFDFAHDIFGIQQHINRQTGRLENCFLSRYSV